MISQTYMVDGPPKQNKQTHLKNLRARLGQLLHGDDEVSDKIVAAGEMRQSATCFIT